MKRGRKGARVLQGERGTIWSVPKVLLHASHQPPESHLPKHALESTGQDGADGVRHSPSHWLANDGVRPDGVSVDRHLHRHRRAIGRCVYLELGPANGTSVPIITGKETIDSPLEVALMMFLQKRLLPLMGNFLNLHLLSTQSKAMHGDSDSLLLVHRFYGGVTLAQGREWAVDSRAAERASDDLEDIAAHVLDGSELVTTARNDDDVGDIGEDVEHPAALLFVVGPGACVGLAPELGEGDGADDELEDAGVVHLRQR